MHAILNLSVAAGITRFSTIAGMCALSSRCEGQLTPSQLMDIAGLREDTDWKRGRPWTRSGDEVLDAAILHWKHVLALSFPQSRP